MSGNCERIVKHTKPLCLFCGQKHLDFDIEFMDVTGRRYRMWVDTTPRILLEGRIKCFRGELEIFDSSCRIVFMMCCSCKNLIIGDIFEMNKRIFERYPIIYGSPNLFKYLEELV